jgi:hypothetical protein
MPLNSAPQQDWNLRARLRSPSPKIALTSRDVSTGGTCRRLAGGECGTDGGHAFRALVSAQRWQDNSGPDPF